MSTAHRRFINAHYGLFYAHLAVLLEDNSPHLRLEREGYEYLSQSMISVAAQDMFRLDRRRQGFLKPCAEA